jgi:VanZ family protein
MGTPLKIVRFWFPVIAYSGMIFYLSSMPSLKSPIDVPYIDKVIHIGEYTLFAWLLAWAWVNTKRGPSLTIFLWVIAISLLHGMGDEYHQSFVVGRESTVGDVIADFIGGIIGGYIYLFVKLNKRSV